MKTKTSYSWILALLLAGAFIPAKAQISYDIMPVPATVLTVRQLGQIQVTNSGAPSVKYITMELRNGSERILTTEYQGVEIRSGSSIIPLGALVPAVKVYGSSEAASTLSLTGKLISGNYSVCVDIADQPTSSFENCLSFEVRPLTPPILVHPANEATVPTVNPLLTWMPPAPNEPGITYSLRLTQIDEGQTAIDALERNPIIYLGEGLTRNVQIYPPTSTPLVPGKKYAWQVEAFNGTYSLGITEVWGFTVKEPEIQPIVSGTSFYKAKKIQDGTHCIADPILKIMIPESKIGESVRFQLSDATGKEIKAYTRAATLLQLKPGDNFFAIDLRETAELESGQFYFMSLKTQSGKYYIAFQYKNEEARH